MPHMKAEPSANAFDVIVIGSGMGGMTTAAAIDPRLFRKIR
jgi:cation diffusion facilitator CzcD-associated flavoprotein CzcO